MKGFQTHRTRLLQVLSGGRPRLSLMVSAGYTVANAANALKADTSIYFCPDYNPALQLPTAKPANSYAVNVAYFGTQSTVVGTPPTQWSVPLTKVPTPAQDIFVAESSGLAPYTTGDDIDTEYSSLATYPYALSDFGYFAARNRHSGGSVYLLGDGHAKWFTEPTEPGALTPISAVTSIPSGFEPATANVPGAAYSKIDSPNAAAWCTETGT